ncbi:MAG TPA: MerR family transcriptional regulator [Beijerinckiaceae bacterium]|jgi:DNA-binding transcriptional MerR regulator|nr:MerR family transcriptional regulator [Beijerinckiaceae bacterium]
MDKSSEAFRTITEVAENLDLPQHVLRFWETRFSQIKPLKRAGGRRYYRPEDVQLITAIRRLLYDEGFTIRGVQRLLREKGAKAITAGAVPPFGGRDNGGSAASTGEGEIESADEILHARNGAELHHDVNGAREQHAFASAPQVAALDRMALESVLQQLSECRRILDGALHPHN